MRISFHLSLLITWTGFLHSSSSTTDKKQSKTGEDQGFARRALTLALTLLFWSLVCTGLSWEQVWFVSWE